jgi:hypothetical protein
MRPECKACHVVGKPTINGYCVAHMNLDTHMALYTAAAEDVLFLISLDQASQELPV